MTRELVRPPIVMATSRRTNSIDVFGGQERRGADDVTLTAVGFAASAIGAVGGALLGYGLDREILHSNGGDDPGILGAMSGWFAGSALATPVSVHLANGRHGSLRRAYLSSAFVGGAGMAGLLIAGSPEGVVFLYGTPIAQVVSAVLAERSRGR